MSSCSPDWDRKCFEARIAIVLCGVALFGCVAQPVEIESTVDVAAYSATIRGYFRRPAGAGPFPTVILMHGCSGLTAGVRRGLNRHASYLASRGFASLVLDSFSHRPNRDGYVCRRSGELNAARYYRQYDAFHAFRFLEKKSLVDSSNIFLMGQSNGGSVALGAAAGLRGDALVTSARFQAIAAYYPWCGALPTRPRKIVTPLLVFGAGRDDWVSPEYCVSAQASVEGAAYKVIVYTDALHGFDLPVPVQSYAGHTVGGNTADAAGSRKEMADWFQRHLQ